MDNGKNCRRNVKTTKRNQGLALVDDFFGVREEDLVNQTDLAFAIADLCGPGLGCDEDIEAYCSTVKDVDILRRAFVLLSQMRLMCLLIIRLKDLNLTSFFVLKPIVLSCLHIKEYKKILSNLLACTMSE